MRGTRMEIIALVYGAQKQFIYRSRQCAARSVRTGSIDFIQRARNSSSVR